MTMFIDDNAGWVLFLWVLGNQAGVPVPVVPPLLAAGALARTDLEFMSILAVTVGAALCADLTWYAVGRWRGAQTLARLRRHFRWASAHVDRLASLSPAHQVALLLSARFLPEINPITAGVAGATRTPFARYLLCAAATALVWAVTWMGLGYAVGAVLAGGI